MDKALTLLRDAEREIKVQQNGKPTTAMILGLVNAATLALEQAGGVGEIKDIRDKLDGIEVYLKKQKVELVNSNLVVAQRMRTERELGKQIPYYFPQGGDRKSKTPTGYLKLADYGIDDHQSAKWQRYAAVENDDFELWVQEHLETDEITGAGLLKLYSMLNGKPHVSFNSGNNEWYTPLEYAAAAACVMGGIDLDPASSEIANETVGAAVYFTAEDDGLVQDWRGRVWMNPPYASELIGDFCDKLVRHYQEGAVTEAVVLVNNATETGWFNALISVASAVVFPKGRVKFNMPGGEAGAPLQGQVVVYLGDKPDTFLDEFSQFGWGAEVCRR